LKDKIQPCLSIGEVGQVQSMAPSVKVIFEKNAVLL